MDKQNVNTTPAMKGKGDSSSSHYRINSGNGARVLWGWWVLKRKLDTLDSGADVLNPSAMHIERVSDESDPITNETINGISLKLSQGLHLEISRSREIN